MMYVTEFMVALFHMFHGDVTFLSITFFFGDYVQFIYAGAELAFFACGGTEVTKVLSGEGWGPHIN